MLLRAETIRRRLKRQRIQSRATTLTTAFAGAIAPNDDYDSARIIKAMRDLKQNPNKLKCVFCGKPATEWDHLFPLVKGKTFSGYGHWRGISSIMRKLQPIKKRKELVGLSKIQSSQPTEL